MPHPQAHDEVVKDLPLLHVTPQSWAKIAAADLPTFLSDHAVCEQQAALFALSLIGQYPDDDDLVERMSALAAEEAVHLRRVHAILRRRGLKIARRRPNPWVHGLRANMQSGHGPMLKADRLFLGALIEARSCERFTCLLSVLEDQEVERLLFDLGPAEKRHWEMFYALAQRELEGEAFDQRWQFWLEVERDLMKDLGVGPTVHG